MRQIKSHPFRIAFLMLFGAAFGWVVLADYLFVKNYGYHHGFGEGWWCDPTGTAIGAAFGLAFEVALRAIAATRKS